MTRKPAGPPPGPTPSPLLNLFARHPRVVVLCCFFLSGGTGLVYEVVWSRRLTLTFGATVLAVSTVLAAFLGGLALGSVIFGRIVDRRNDPLRLYAALEAGVGLICFVTPWLFVLVERTYLHIHPAIADSIWLIRLVRFGLCAVVLVIPTALMGGTLPALSRAVVRRDSEVGSHVAALYGINTLGAVLGATAAGFVLIPTIGIRGTVYLAAVLNLGIATVAFALHAVQAAEAPAARPAEKQEPAPIGTHRAYQMLLVAYGLSGAAALVYEVGWTRILALAFGTSTYAFSAMLAAFLAGLGLGSLVLATPRWFSVDRLRQPLVWFGVIEVAIGASVTFLTPLLDHLPFTFLTIFRMIGPRFWALQFAELGVCFLVMLLPAALMGFAFPLVTRIATENIGVLGRRLSGVYAANTFGTVVGSFVAGFVLIPALGVRHALAVGVALNLLVGLVYLTAYARQRPRLAGGGIALGVVAAAAWIVLPNWNQAVLTSGAYIYPGYYLQSDALQRMQEKQILHYRDALTGTISVTRVVTPLTDKPLLSLQINGKTDASTGDLSTQLLHAHLPALLHPDPKSALMIGLASGCTLGALELHKGIQHIDCVEIEPEMARVTQFFKEINHDCLRDPRVNLILDDARNFVLVSRRQYDVITSEPSNPWIAGVANLFTREHFRMCRDHLAPGGIFCQWIPLYNLAPNDLRCIVATFHDVFPDCSFWVFPDLVSDAYLIGTLTPQTLDPSRIAARAADPLIQADLRTSHLRDLWDLLGGYLFGSDVMAGLAQGVRLNTDNFPILEFSSPMTLHTGIAKVTLDGVLALAKKAEPPLKPRDASSGPASALAGLTFAAPWTPPRSEALDVRRNPQAFSSGQPDQWVQTSAHVVAGLGGGEADIHVRRAEAMPPEDFPANPTGFPDRQIAVAGHQASVWLGPKCPAGVAWQATWTCPERSRAYFIIAKLGAAGNDVSVEDALKGISCEG